jgi:hypothetical protein
MHCEYPSIQQATVHHQAAHDLQWWKSLKTSDKFGNTSCKIKENITNSG